MVTSIKHRGWKWSVSDASNPTLLAVLDNTNKALHFATAGDADTDWNVAADSNPALYIHSETTPATDYLLIGRHDGTTAYIDVVGGTTLQLAIAGSNEVTLTASALSPAVSNGNALGTTALMWADLFLASGAVVNFDNGNVTITHSANILTINGVLNLTQATLGAAVNAVDVAVTVSAPNNQEGMSAYFQADINGTTAGHCYGLGSWINTGATSPVLAAGHIIVPFEGGVYTGEAQASARIVFAGQHQAILNGAPASLHAWRLNTTQTITALITAANSGSVGYTAGAGTSGTQLGYIPFATIVGVNSGNPVYIRVYATAT